MKEKKLKNHRTGARTLSIHTTRGEELDYERAEWLTTWPSPVLLKFKYEVKSHKNLFFYDITGLPTLKQYLRMGISRSQYVSLLRSLGRLGDLCSKVNLPMEILRFEPENVYVANDGMVFCCLPMSPVVQQMPVLALLGLLANPKKVKFVLPADRELTARTMDFVRRSRVFSAFDFNEFLASNFGGGSGSPIGQSSASQDFSSRGHSQEAVFDPFAADVQRPSVSGSDAQNDLGRQNPAARQSSFGQTGFNPPKASLAPVTPSLPIPGRAAFGVDIPKNVNASNVDSASGSDEETRPSLKYPTSVPSLPVQSSQPSGEADAESRGAKGAADTQLKNPQASFDSGTRALSGALRPSNPVLAGTDSSNKLRAATHGAMSNGVAPNVMGNQAGPINSNFSPQNAVPGSFAVVRDSDGSRLCSATTTVIIGRSKRCPARVTGNTNVSRMHASVTDLGGGRFSVADLGSANGTTVAGRVLHQGDQAEIGRGEHFSVADESLHLE